MSIKAIAEKQQALYARMQEMCNLAEKEERSFSAEEQSNWERLNEDYNGLQMQKERRQLLLSKEQEFRGAQEIVADETRTSRDQIENESRAYGQRVDLALRSWGRAICGKELSDEDRQVCRSVGFNPHSNEFGFRMSMDMRSVKRDYHLFKRALSAVTGAAGQFTVQEGFMPNLERAMLSYGSVRQAAEILRTETGNDMPWPTADDTSQKGALLAENTAAPEQDVAFGQIIWKAWKYTSKMIKVPNELLEDSAFRLDVILPEMLGERLGRIWEEHYTTGDDVSKPKGIVPSAAASTSTAIAATLGGDDIISLFHATDPAQRGPGFAFMAHDAIYGEIRKLKAGDDNYLWVPGFNERPDTILGYPTFINQEMDSTIATSNEILLAGNLTKYKVREVSSMRVVRLVERFGDADQQAFVIFARADGRLLNPGSSNATNPVHKLTVS